jgi:uncharacterized membrane protein HdeD (DUF308 family)
MSSSLAAEWRLFRADSPGERFCNHYQRARRASKAKRIIQLLIGVILVLAGIVLCFIPGPGLLVMVFGFALLSSMLQPVARALDRMEVWLRRRLGRPTSRAR